MKLLATALVLCVAAVPASSDLVITEIMQNPAAVADADGEWFEVFNSGPGSIDMNGYTVYDEGTNSFTISGPLEIPGGGFAVFCVNGDFATNGGVNVDYVFSGSSFAIANGDDEIYIADTGMNVVDFVRYDGGPVWPDPTGASMYFLGGGDNNDGTQWTEETTYTYGAGDFGTPGYGFATAVEAATWSAIKELYR